MLIIILFQCFINVYGVAYYPLGEYDLDTGMLEIDLEFDEPRWVTINHPHAHPWPANAPYPNCILGPEHFWYYEEHPDIVGNGTRENPTGPYATTQGITLLREEQQSLVFPTLLLNVFKYLLLPTLYYNPCVDSRTNFIINYCLCIAKEVSLKPYIKTLVFRDRLPLDRMVLEDLD